MPVLDLGEQALTGVFPATPEDAVTVGPLRLVWCPDSGLLQLAHSYDLGEMYGENYGYRSGLNQSMVDHLTTKIREMERDYELEAGDAVLDIGSNDATSLAAYQTTSLIRTGIDPSGGKFRSFYKGNIRLVPEFFSADAYHSTGSPPPKLITSIAMLYDVENPIEFAQEIDRILAPGGIWHFEQSYMPSMLRHTSYDAICHEHLEYYSLQVVLGIIAEAGFRAVDVRLNDVNGGSFAVTAVRRDDPRRGGEATMASLLDDEERMGLATPRPYREFEERVLRHRDNLRGLLEALTADGKLVLGYGASTKGNVVLQFCGIGPTLIPAIADVNPDKFGKITPGTHIPIVSEAEARAMRPDYYLVLPWHFRAGIIRREAQFLASGGRMIFPFPEIEIV